MYLLWTNSTHLADKHLTSKLTIICYIKIKKPVVCKKLTNNWLLKIYYKIDNLTKKCYNIKDRFCWNYIIIYSFKYCIINIYNLTRKIAVSKDQNYYNL